MAESVTPQNSPAPYYQDDACTIYHGDCLDMWWPRFRCLLTDPPYGASFRSNFRAARFDFIVGDQSPAEFSWMPLAVAAQEENGPAFVFANEATIGPTRDALALHKYRVQRTVVWDKGNMSQGDLNNFGVQTEFIAYGTNRHGKASLNGPRTANLLAVPRVGSKVSVHPAQKPLPLLSFLILRATGLGEVVCDPFMGSGSTLVAARDVGRAAVGIEIEERYCEIAAKRLAQEVLAL